MTSLTENYTYNTTETQIKRQADNGGIVTQMLAFTRDYSSQSTEN